MSVKNNHMEGIAMELKGSKTEQNLIAAFAGESQARTAGSGLHQRQELPDILFLCGM